MFLDFILSYWREVLQICNLLTGAASVYLTAKENRWGWFLTAVSSFILAIINFISKLYSSVVISLFYVITSAIAFKKWQPKRKKDIIKIEKIDKKYAIKMFGIMAATFTFSYTILRLFTNANAMFWDSINTSFKVSGQFASIDKKLESWLLLIITDIIGFIIYTMQGLYITTILYVIYFALDLFAYFEWRKRVVK